MLEGKLTQSSETAQSALLVAQQNGRRGHEAWALRLLGELALCRPDAPLARDHFTRALALTTALDMRPLSAHCYFGLGRALRMANDHQAAERHLATAVDLFREMDMGVWLAQAATEKDKRT